MTLPRQSTSPHLRYPLPTARSSKSRCWLLDSTSWSAVELQDGITPPMSSRISPAATPSAPRLMASWSTSQSMSPQGGSFTELINVPRAATVPVPDGTDPVQLAGLLNPVMASWMALATRTAQLPQGFTAVIFGASSLSGTVAVSVARAFGAGKVVGVARSAAKMASLGLDAAVELKDDAESTDFTAALDADVILDFLYGPGMLALFKALKPQKPVQYVQVGTIAGPTIEFPGDLLRGKDITLRGDGPGAWQMSQFAEQTPKMVEAIASGKIAPHSFAQVKLEDIADAWVDKSAERKVIVP